jgi:hypothetical protein
MNILITGAHGFVGRYPPLDASAAQAIGFRHDGDIDALIANALVV